MARFVVVDDSKFARMFLKNLLTAAGHEVVAEGENGLEGLDLYMQHKPDIITLDVVMPVVTGMECLKKLMPKHPDAKVVMVTSVGKDSSIEEALSVGAKAFILKPIREDETLATIDAVLSA